MNELAELLRASPQAAMVGATVYLILAVRRLESRIETIASQVGAPPPARKRRATVGVIIAFALALSLSACTTVKTTKPDGTVIETRYVHFSTNAAPTIKATRQLIESLPRGW